MLVYLLETNILEERTEYKTEAEAVLGSYHYPDFEVKVYNIENNKRVLLDYYFKGGVKKIKTNLK